ncbi:hypothetical protein KR093_004857, partial [Drosophila rubida]
ANIYLHLVPSPAHTVSKSNSVDLYRPPALRNNSTEEAAAASIEAATTNDTRDESVAIGTTSEADTAKTAITTTSTTTSNASKVAAAAATRRERRPDRAVYVPRARRSQTTPPTTTTTAATTMPLPASPSLSTPTQAAVVASTCNTESPLQLEPLALPVVDTNPSKSDDSNAPATVSAQQQQGKPKKPRSRRERGKKTTAKPLEAATLLVIAPSENEVNQVTTTPTPSPPDNHCDKEMMAGAQRTKSGGHGSKGSQQHKQQQSLRIEDANNVTTTTDDANKCDNEVRELQRASKEINRSNRRIMKQTFVSDVLEIPDKIETAPKVTAAAAAAATAADSTTEDDEEENGDDWENMFDENGDCLDPKILQELTDSVGKCKIELPKMDYSVYHIKQSLLNEEEFPHVLEISNFPVEFKTPDLLMLFSRYKGTGFDIKWVDDTHALAVFSSSDIAAEVLTMGHPFVKLKPLAAATLESRLKAKKAGATSLQPYRQRPETCTALARRLVSGALGVKLPTAPEERENERRVLREAKERKLLAAKQRDEVWES